MKYVISRVNYHELKAGDRAFSQYSEKPIPVINSGEWVGNGVISKVEGELNEEKFEAFGDLLLEIKQLINFIDKYKAVLS